VHRERGLALVAVRDALTWIKPGRAFDDR